MSFVNYYCKTITVRPFVLLKYFVPGAPSSFNIDYYTTPHNKGSNEVLTIGIFISGNGKHIFLPAVCYYSLFMCGFGYKNA